MKYVVTGRVQPERADVSISRLEFKISDSIEAVMSCDASQLTVILKSESIDGWITAKLHAEAIASIVVNALGFSLGSGYSVEIIQVTEQDGTPRVIGVRPVDPETESGTLGFQPHNDIFNRALLLSIRDVFFRLAIRDYLQAINDAADCPMYCYRAIESIKSSFVFKSGHERWDEMHAALGTDRASINTTIKEFADPIRHGNWIKAKYTDKYLRWRMLSMTQGILLAYLTSGELAQ